MASKDWQPSWGALTEENVLLLLTNGVVRMCTELLSQQYCRAKNTAQPVSAIDRGHGGLGAIREYLHEAFRA